MFVRVFVFCLLVVHLHILKIFQFVVHSVYLDISFHVIVFVGVVIVVVSVLLLDTMVNILAKSCICVPQDFRILSTYVLFFAAFLGY